jgi:hypothetical protein
MSARIGGALLGTGMGVLLAFMAIGAAVDSQGGVVAKLLFPYTWSAAPLVGRLPGTNWLFLAAATAQFPFYGAAVGLAIAVGRPWRTAAALVALHAAAGALACLL